MVYLSNWKPNHGFEDLYISHLWSLAVEEQFYLVWPCIVWFTPAKWFSWVCLPFIVVAPILRWILLGQGMTLEAVYRLTVCRMDALVIGALIAWAMRTSYWPTMKAKAGIIALVSAAVAGAFFVKEQGPEWSGTIATIGDSALITFFAAVIVVSLSRSSVASALSASWLRKIGKYSYAMYLFHEVLNQALAGRFMHRVQGSAYEFWAKGAFVIGAILLTYSLSHLSWIYFERRFLVLKNRLAPRLS